MTKTAQTPGSVLQSFIDEYHINPFLLSKEIKLSYHTVLNILKGKGKITVPTAIRLGTYFDNTPAFWLDVQSSSEINELTSNKKFVSIIKSIPKAKKPTVKASAGTKAKPKSNTLSEKRKKAAKVPGARAARGKRTRT